MYNTNMAGGTIKTPTKESYAREHDYQAAILQHSHDFDALLDSVPEEQVQVRETTRGMFYTKSDKLLDPEKLQKLKQENPSLFGQVSGYYSDYIKKVLGLD